MALQGSIETFALADVLRFLASSANAGCLAVRGARGETTLWFDAGRLVGGTTAADDPDVDIVDVVFDALRTESGEFEFLTDRVCEAPEGPFAVDEVLAAAQEQLEEWRELTQVVPTPQARLALREELPYPEVVVDQACWTSIVSVGSGLSAAELAERLQLSELSTARLIRALVGAGFLTVNGEVPELWPTAPETAAVAAALFEETLVAPQPVASEPASTDPSAAAPVVPAAAVPAAVVQPVTPESVMSFLTDELPTRAPVRSDDELASLLGTTPDAAPVLGGAADRLSDVAIPGPSEHPFVPESPAPEPPFGAPIESTAMWATPATGDSAAEPLAAGVSVDPAEELARSLAHLSPRAAQALASVAASEAEPAPPAAPTQFSSIGEGLPPVDPGSWNPTPVSPTFGAHNLERESRVESADHDPDVVAEPDHDEPSPPRSEERGRFFKFLGS